MTADFTLFTYRSLLERLLSAGYGVRTMNEYAEHAAATDTRRLFGGVPLMLRHDVDRLPRRAAAMARVERELGVSATYFFRIKRESLAPSVVEEISKLGHEIGFHYEELADTNGDRDAAWELFQKNLEHLRNFAPITSIAMHGRPFSPWDNRDIWETYDYRQTGISLEAYRDIPWNQFAYFTDTGRSWCSAWNQKDKVGEGLTISGASALRSTDELANLLVAEQVPTVISTHPERWTSDLGGWTQVYVTDSAINFAKMLLSLKRRATHA